MAKDPAFLFYPGDYIGGTMGMTFEEKGAYMDLLMMQFNQGHMTSRMIAQVVGQLWDNIKHKFKIDNDGLYYNERLDIEKEKRKSFVESRKNNISGNNQYSKVRKKRGHTTKHMTSHMEDVNINEDKDITTKTTTTKKKKYLDSVLLSDEEYRTLGEKLGDINRKKYIESLDCYIGSKGKKYKSHYKTILAWWHKDGDPVSGKNLEYTGAKPTCEEPIK